MGRVVRCRGFRRRFAPLLLVGACAATSGCLDFEEEEVHVAYDAERDRLDAQLVYRGFASDESGAERQLDQLLSGRPLFALFDGMATYDLIELRESDDAQVAELAKLTAVDRGDLFRSEDGRICGWQHLRVRNATRVIEIWDAMLRAKLADASERKELSAELCCEDAVSIAFWSDALAKQKRWLERSGDELLWHVPASATAARALAAPTSSCGTPRALRRPCVSSSRRRRRSAATSLRASKSGRSCFAPT